MLLAGALTTDVAVHAIGVDEVGGNPLMPWPIADAAAVLIVLVMVCAPARTAAIRWQVSLTVSALLVSTAILVWGTGLAAATLHYWRGTRPGCTDHQEPARA
jgi:hypothetical protein